MSCDALGCSDKHCQVAREGRCEKLVHCPWNVVPCPIVFDPRFRCWPRVQTVFTCLTIPSICGQHVVHWCLLRQSFGWPHYNISDKTFPATSCCPWPLFNQLSYSWNSTILCFCQKLLNHVSPCVPTGKFSRQEHFFQHNQTKNAPVPRLSFCAPKIEITNSFSLVAAVRSNVCAAGPHTQTVVSQHARPEFL